jgi:hypothetical protein
MIADCHSVTLVDVLSPQASYGANRKRRISRISRSA